MKKELLAEFLGTFILVFAGTGAVIVDSIFGNVTHLGIGIVFGFVVTALIYAFGHISGAHFNPAVTIAFAIHGDFEKKYVPHYILVQLLGATLASLFLYILFMENFTDIKDVSYLGATLPSGSLLQSFIFEFILTTILMLVIFASAIHAKAVKIFAGVSIGFTVGIEAIFAGPVCGASMNPARSIGPAVISGELSSLWIYIVAPILGAIFSVFLYKNLKD